MKRGILLMSLGSPNQLDEMEAYLTDIRKGRTPSREFVEEIQNRYRLAGGKSPLLEITRRQAMALEKRLSGENVKVYVGMRHWHPYIKSTLSQMLKDGLEHLTSLPLTPYYSKLSFEAYHEAVRETLTSLDADIPVSYVKSWHDHPQLISLFAELIREKLSPNMTVLFTAHSLPERILRENDPYPHELKNTVNLVAQQLGLTEWHFAHQSQGGSQEPWLGPKVEEMLERFANEKKTKVLIVPIGFVSDHMEILYDIDVLFQGIAKEKGIHLIRTELPNDRPSFIEVLASVATLNDQKFIIC